MFQLFNRATFGKDLATGKKSSDGYSSVGPLDSFSIRHKLPPPPPVVCNLYAVFGSCTLQQYEALVKRIAKIVDWIVVKPAGGAPGGV